MTTAVELNPAQEELLDTLIDDYYWYVQEAKSPDKNYGALMANAAHQQLHTIASVAGLKNEDEALDFIKEYKQ